MDVTDAELVQQIGADSTQRAAAETELVRRFARRIRGYGLRHLREPNDAEDLVQQVLFTVIKSLRAGKLQDPQQLASFVLGTCRLTAQSLRSREHRRDRLLEQYGIRDDAVDARAPLDLDRLRGCLEGLAPRDRTIVVASFFAERNADDIGSELNMTAVHVRVSRHRALGLLRECMGGDAA
jgi:RNA polymerase sigma-70 factor (ECF subfamily)